MLRTALARCPAETLCDLHGTSDVRGQWEIARLRTRFDRFPSGKKRLRDRRTGVTVILRPGRDQKDAHGDKDENRTVEWSSANDDRRNRMLVYTQFTYTYPKLVATTCAMMPERMATTELPK